MENDMRKYVKVTMYDRPTVDLNVFVIPNKASKVSGNKFVENGFYGRVESVFNANDMSINLNDWLIQIWYTGSGCDDWENHYPVTQLDNEDYYVRFASYDIPYDLCKEWKEGETVTLTMPVELVSVNDPSKIKRKLWTLRVTPRQKEYRYRSFGTFEDARLKVVL